MPRPRLGAELEQLHNDLIPSEKAKESLRRYDATKQALEERPGYAAQQHIIHQAVSRTKLGELQLLKLEEAHKAGDSNALARCIALCFEYDMLPPQWASLAYLRGYQRIAKREANWEDVLGKPNKGKHLKEMRPDEEKQKIYREVKRLQAQGQPTDAGLFETVGPRYGSPSGKEIRTIYYDITHKRIARIKAYLRGLEIVRDALAQLGHHVFKR